MLNKKDGVYALFSVFVYPVRGRPNYRVCERHHPIHRPRAWYHRG